MYNRYIPQPDGSFQRNKMPEPEQQPPASPKPSQSACKPESAPDPCCPTFSQSQVSGQPHSCQNRQHRRPCPPPQKPPCQNTPPKQNTGIFQFFRQLLPRDFDTEDLLVVLLLLLMSGDCKEDQNTALLTLALYLFM